jgi:hypothetical protein
MICCSRCGDNLRLHDFYFEILVGVHQPIDHPDRVVGEMCQSCLEHKIQPLLKQGRLLTGAEYPNEPELVL